MQRIEITRAVFIGGETVPVGSIITVDPVLASELKTAGKAVDAPESVETETAIDPADVVETEVTKPARKKAADTTEA